MKTLQNEELIQEITQLILEQMQGRTLQGDPEKCVKVGVSARHVHLCRADMDTLFGPGSELTPFKELMGGQYAAKETVTIIGLKLRPIENVRVLGPLRKKTQVEVSATDCIRLGVKAPVRLSGDLEGSAPIIIVGPKGAVTLKEGCIVAQRHIHMSPEEAARFGLHDKQVVCVQAPSARGGLLENVPVRMDPSFTTEMHIDTDESNAAGLKGTVDGEILA